MVDRDEVFAAADRLYGEGRMVSIRAVRTSLRQRGSYRDLGPLVGEWKAKREYQPRIEIAGVPLVLQNRHGDALAGLWTAACAHAAERFDDDRERARQLVRASDAIRDEALLEVDRLVDEVSTLRSEVEHLRVLVTEKDARLSRIRSEEFWDRLMREVVVIIPEDGGMSAEEILPRLRDSVHREAASHKEDVTASVLRRKMMTRVTHGKYFEALPDGSFARRVRRD